MEATISRSVCQVVAILTDLICALRLSPGKSTVRWILPTARYNHAAGVHATPTPHRTISRRPPLFKAHRPQPPLPKAKCINSRQAGKPCFCPRSFSFSVIPSEVGQKASSVETARPLPEPRRFGERLATAERAAE